jgi:hypothetical protein
MTDPNPEVRAAMKRLERSVLEDLERQVEALEVFADVAPDQLDRARLALSLARDGEKYRRMMEPGPVAKLAVAQALEHRSQLVELDDATERIATMETGTYPLYVPPKQEEDDG